jgi:exonuclease SbcD
VLPYREKNVPLIATGHLFATGSALSDSEKDIHVGYLGQISTDHFPDVFDYVALGHLHRQQTVAGHEHIRYSGSLIPLGFQEAAYPKGVFVAEFDGARLQSVQTLSVPLFRRLLRFQGDFETVKAQLEAYDDGQDAGPPAWAEVSLSIDQMRLRLDVELREIVKDKNLELLKIVINRPYQSLDIQVKADLEDLQPIDVFRERCRSEGKPPEEMKELEETFQILYERIMQQESP